MAYQKMLMVEPIFLRSTPSQRTTKNSQKEKQPLNKPDVESEDEDILEGLAKANASGVPQKVFSKKLNMNLMVPPTKIRLEEVSSIKNLK